MTTTMRLRDRISRELYALASAMQSSILGRLANLVGLNSTDTFYAYTHPEVHGG